VKKNAHRVLAGKNDGKRALGRPGFSWQENIKMNLS
jgi:hypothetical protein